MKLIIFSGFLGSGKTMSILSLAKKIMETKSIKNTRLVIVENEVGETGIDDKVLSTTGFTVESLLSGCICCTLQTELTKAINEIEENFSPDYVIFEPSGVAYPDRIINTLKKFGKSIESIKLVTLVDASRWEKLMTVTPLLIKGQLKNANVILINKCDLANDHELNKIENDIKEINTKAIIHKIIASENIKSVIWDSIL
jgi:G3E family GTPase